MRTGLNFLQTLIGLTTITVLVACGDDGGGTGGGGGGDTGTGAGAGDATTAAGPGPGSVTSTGTTPVGPGPSSSSTGGGDCTANVFDDPTINSCGQANCCDEMLACEANNFEDCVDFDAGTIDPNSPAGGPLLECMETNGCFGDFAEWCDSGIGFQDPDEEAQAFAECISDNCCDPLDACTQDGTDVQTCLDCLNGELTDAEGNPTFALCEAVSDCSAEFCGQSLIFVPICDSPLGLPSEEIAECLGANCCEEFTTCTGDGSDEDIQACIDCFNAEEPGPLCQPALECELANCNTAICESGLTIENVELSQCLTASCCTEFTACTDGGTDEAAIQACIDCFNAYDPDSGVPAGETCAAAIACEEANCAGGEGGGGGGGGGTGGAGGAGGGI